MSSSGGRWRRLRAIVLERDVRVCAYCGDVASTVDHVVPRSRGGSDDLLNLVAACHSCNSRKRARTFDEYIAWRTVRDLEAPA